MPPGPSSPGIPWRSRVRSRKSTPRPTRPTQSGGALLIFCIVDPSERKLSSKEGFVGDLFASHPPMRLRLARPGHGLCRGEAGRGLGRAIRARRPEDECFPARDYLLQRSGDRVSITVPAKSASSTASSRHPFLVGPRGGERVVDLHGADDPRAHRNRRPREPVGIAPSVPPFVMVANVLDHLAEMGQGGEDVGAGDRMGLHLLELLIRERAVLVQDLLTDTDLADIVETPAVRISSTCSSSMPSSAATMAEKSATWAL